MNIIMNEKMVKKKKFQFLHIPFLLDINGEVVEGKIKIDIKGPLKKIFLSSGRFLELIKYLDNQKPAFVGEKLVFSVYLPEIPSKAFKRVLKNDFIKRSLKLPGGPDAATLAITQSCNAHCKHCSAYRRAYTPQEELTTEEWINVIKQLLSIGCYNITFTGGEPLLREDIFELIRNVDKSKAIVQMFTNGFYLNNETAWKLKESGLDSVHISIESSDPDKHDSICGVKGLFQKDLEGVKYSLDAGILTGLCMIATPEAIIDGEIERFLELGKKLDVTCITFADPVPTGRLLKKEIILTGQYRDYMEKLHLEINSKGSFPRVETQAYTNGPRGGGCFAGFNQIHVTPVGYVTPCDLTPLSFGNVREESIKSIWKKIRKHPEYKKEVRSCRMQDPKFRENYIRKIPENAELPYPIQLLD